MQKAIGPYEVLDQLGHGGMGVVYRARDTRLHREVAVKVLSDAFLTPETPGQPTHERFLREARSASSLNHPNICTIYDVGEQDGKPYLVMELLQGQTLKDTLRTGPLPLAEALEFSIQIARGLEEAHEAGIIHRDIKPANIFVVRRQQGSQQAKILDFGLAKRTGSQTVAVAAAATSDSLGLAETAAANSITIPGSTVGTVAYMSPEQARGEALDVRSDLFSLGAVMYEMVTGRLPFPGAVTADIYAALLMREPEPPRKLNPAISREVERIILKLLAKERSQRYRTAAELRADLSPLVARSSASNTAAVAGLPAPLRRLPLLPLVGGAIAVALAAGGVFWWHGHRTQAPQPPVAKVAQISKPPGNRDSVLLANFSNETGDPAFDTVLDPALAMQLRQSPLLALVSQNHLRQSLLSLGKSADDKITPEIAREIALREGIKAVVSGTLARLGNAYIVTLEVRSGSTGDTIAHEQSQAIGKEHVLTALHQAVGAVRAHLGESAASIRKSDAPAAQAVANTGQLPSGSAPASSSSANAVFLPRNAPCATANSTAHGPCSAATPLPGRAPATFANPMRAPTRTYPSSVRPRVYSH
jgi:tRNA A-37 threonylcarbamoyl transferase component Bud32